MERKGVDNHIIPSSSTSVLNQSMKVATLVNLERRCLEMELAARDAENKKIREEILMKAEILKERELEDKIIRKFVLEGNIGAREILSLLGSQGSSVGADKKIPYVSSHQWNQTELADSGALPFQREPKAMKKAIPTPVFNLCKDTPMHVVKPMLNVPPAAGTKRKFETENANGGEPSMSMKAQKKQLVEWSCDLCKVKTSCEDLLKAHLIGKKHLAKERSLKKVHGNAPKTTTLVQPPLPNAPTEPALKIKVAPPQLPTEPALKKAHANAPKTAAFVPPPLPPNASLGPMVDEVKPMLNVPPAAGTKRKFETENANGGEPSMSMKGQKKQLVEWSCDLCKVKTSCDDLLKAHLIGKKHLAKEWSLKNVHGNAPKTAALVQPPLPNAPTEPALEIKVVPPQLPKVPPPLANARPVPALEIKVPPPRLPNASVGHVVDEVDVAGMKRKFEFVKETGSVMQAEKKQVLDWSCTLCGVKTTGEEQLKSHLIGKKHKTKESFTSSTRKTSINKVEYGTNSTTIH